MELYNVWPSLHSVSFVHVVAWIGTPFLYIGKEYSIACIYHIIFYPFISRWTFGLFLPFGYYLVCHLPGHSQYTKFYIIPEPDRLVSFLNLLQAGLCCSTNQPENLSTLKQQSTDPPPSGVNTETLFIRVTQSPRTDIGFSDFRRRKIKDHGEPHTDS